MRMCNTCSVYRNAQVCGVSLQNTLPTASLTCIIIVFSRFRMWTGIILTTLSICKGKTFLLLVHCCHVNLASDFDSIQSEYQTCLIFWGDFRTLVVFICHASSSNETHFSMSYLYIYFFQNDLQSFSIWSSVILCMMLQFFSVTIYKVSKSMTPSVLKYVQILKAL